MFMTFMKANENRKRRATMIMLTKYSEFVERHFNKNLAVMPTPLMMAEDGKLQMYYAPFDYVNTSASVVICGITPGISQAMIALEKAQQELKAGCSAQDADYSAKQTASFAGTMRTNLVKMLDYLEVNDLLEIESTAELFSTRTDLVHYTSALRYPVLNQGVNYSGTPSMTKNAFLKNIVDTYLADELGQLDKNTLIIPLGQAVEDALNMLASRGVIRSAQILTGMPHPSGANAERIKFFLEEKSASDLSAKTNADLIMGRREQAKNIVMNLSV
jgi:hypothetical protein